MKVYNLESPRTGKPVPNQFYFDSYSKAGNRITVFQSYDSIIVIQEYAGGDVVTTLDSTYWNYSKTTSKYRSKFLGETTKETQAKINSGEYVLTNLN